MWGDYHFLISIFSPLIQCFRDSSLGIFSMTLQLESMKELKLAGFTFGYGDFLGNTSVADSALAIGSRHIADDRSHG